jgi:hypothetical protein
MSDSEHFLTRWARLKQETAKLPSAPPESPDETSPAQATEQPRPDLPADLQAAEPPAVDLATLPPLESIDATTDITAFLTRGIPAELAKAALRRAWAADPAIRDFIGLSENAWDFNAPDGVPGFGSIGSADDVRRLLAHFDGTVAAPAAEAETAVAPPAGSIEEVASAPTPASVKTTQADGDADEKCAEESSEVNPGSTPMHNEDVEDTSEVVAVQNKNNTPASTPVSRARGHGGALPQ